jgi:hypothetical protein
MRLLTIVMMGLISIAPAKAADFYVGAGVGLFLFDSTVNTPVGKLVDQGGDAPAYRIFAGVDHVFGNRLFLGGEVLAGVTAGRSRLLLAGQDFTVEVPFYTETVLRAGWRTRGNSAFYLRLGAMVAQVTDGGRTGWRAAPLIGFGAEIPFSGGYLAGLDVSWTDLDGLEIWQGGVRLGYRW